MSEETKTIRDMQLQIEGLLNRVEDLENRKPTLVKGPPGDISAALRNVEEAAPKLVEAGLRRLQITTLLGERGPAGQDGVRGEPGRNAIAPTKEIIQRLVDHAVIQALRDYQFLDPERSDCAGSMLRYAIQKELERLAVEQK